MIAVISDSHIPKRAQKIPEEFHEKLSQASTAVHCGDFETQEKYEELKEKYDIIGVKGNCDYFEIEASQKFQESGIKFGVYHGAGITPRGHHPTLVQTAETLDVDVLFHGHTHQEEIAESEGKILLNPGSCTGVGGGSSSEKNPTMMTVQASEQSLEVKIWEKNRESGEIRVKEEEILEAQ